MLTVSNGRSCVQAVYSGTFRVLSSASVRCSSGSVAALSTAAWRSSRPSSCSSAPATRHTQSSATVTSNWCDVIQADARSLSSQNIRERPQGSPVRAMWADVSARDCRCGETCRHSTAAQGPWAALTSFDWLTGGGEGPARACHEPETTRSTVTLDPLLLKT